MEKRWKISAAAGVSCLLLAGLAVNMAKPVPAPAQAGSGRAVGTEAAAEGTEAETVGTEAVLAEEAEPGSLEAGEALVTIDDGAVPLYSKPAGSHVLVPEAPGTVTHSNSVATLDYSNANQGYCMIKYTGSVPKIKVQITKGSVQYTYDLNARDAYEVFPFSEGNGTYSVKVFEQVSGNQYSQALSKDVPVSLTNQYLPFLYPNQYVNFNAGSAVVQTGAQVAAGAADEIGVVNAVYNYVVNNFTYDTARAASVQSGYLPNVDQVLAAKKGICFDYAAVMTSMLRSQDIPTKLVVGYTGDLYHAWVNVYVEGVGWVDNFIYFDGVNWKLMDPTMASSAKNSEDIKKYIGDGANYKSKYSY